MITPYWKRQEVQADLADWIDYYQGCLACACDHGCNQWLDEQLMRAALLYKILTDPTSTTSPDKVARMPLVRVAAIVGRLGPFPLHEVSRESHGVRAYMKFRALAYAEEPSCDKIDTLTEEEAGKIFWKRSKEDARIFNQWLRTEEGKKSTVKDWKAKQPRPIHRNYTPAPDGWEEDQDFLSGMTAERERIRKLNEQESKGVSNGL